MSVLLVPSTSQIEAQLEAMLAKSPDERVLGMRSPRPHAWPETVQARGKPFRLVWCETGLELREQLASLEDDPEARVIILTPIEESSLGSDVLARLPRARLFQSSRWDSVRAAFSARSVDPRLRGHEWLVDLLLERVPPGGYPPAPGGVLDLDTAWRMAMALFMGLPDGQADASDLLIWTMGDGNLERLAALPVAARERIGARLTQIGGPAVALIVGAIASGRGSDAMALGLVCTVLFSGDAQDDVLREAAIRLEPYFGGQPISADAGSALADAARRAADRPLGSVVRNQHERAVALVAEVRADERVACSRVLAAGFEARLRGAAAALVAAAASGSEKDLERAAALVKAALAHDRASEQPQRTERLQMAVRLCRWIGTRRKPAGDFVSAAHLYATDGGYADLCRQALRGEDPVPEVASAYARLRELAMVRREQDNEVFATLLRDWNASGSDGEGVLQIERVLEAIVAPLLHEAPVVLLVLDGLSFATARAICADLSRQGWHELTPRGSSAPPAVIAALPTVTEFSRTSLLTGRLTRGNAGTEKAGFAAHPLLRAKSQAGKPPILFHKADIGAGPELSQVVRNALADRSQKLVGVVHNAIDAQLSGSDQLDFVWSADILRQVSSLLRVARDAGRVVVMTGDHGHVLEECTTQATAAGGDRWRAPGAVKNGEIEMRGGRVWSDGVADAVIMAWSEHIRYSSRRNGYHGGVSPQEVVVPLAVLVAAETPGDWAEAPPAEPAWWRDEPLPIQPRTAYEPPRLPQRPDVRQPELFEVALPPTSRKTWIERLISSQTYAAQRRLVSRGAPTDDAVKNMLLALESRGGRLARGGLAQALGMPAFRVGGLVNAARRVLNVDQAQVLTLEPSSDEVILDARLLRLQFELGEEP